MSEPFAQLAPLLNQVCFVLCWDCQQVGFLPEGINQNPLYYQFLMDINWAEKPIDLEEW